jgi:cellulose biosynthesis protein BcsQ
MKRNTGGGLMKVLLAVNHDEIEQYVSSLAGISIISIVKDRESLLNSAAAYDYEVAVIANELEGNVDMEDIIRVLTAKKSPSQRIVFFYGEWDEDCDDFIRLLSSSGIQDYFIGAEVTSKIIDGLIFNSQEQRSVPNNKKQDYGKGKYHESIKTVDKAVITIMSNQATGKSHTAWNLGYCFSKLGYGTSILNVDRGYSANLYWNIDEIYYDLLSFSISHNKYKDIPESCFRIKNLSIITGRLGDEEEISTEDFIKILYTIRTKSDITIIDTRTGLSEITKQAIRNSTYDLLVFDCDIMHYHMNMLMLEKLKEEFVPEKTIAVINNTNIKTSSHKFIYNELKSTGMPFKDIIPVSACGYLSNEMMHTNKTPYQLRDERVKDFVKDMDSLLERLNAKADIKRRLSEFIRK